MYRLEYGLFRLKKADAIVINQPLGHMVNVHGAPLHGVLAPETGYTSLGSEKHKDIFGEAVLAKMLNIHLVYKLWHIFAYFHIFLQA